MILKACSWCALSENHVLSEALSPLSKLGEFGGESKKHICTQRVISLLSEAFISSRAKRAQLAQRIFTNSC